MMMRWAAVCLVAGAGCLGQDSDGALLERAKRVGAPWEQTEPERPPSAAVIAWREARAEGRQAQEALISKWLAEGPEPLDIGLPAARVDDPFELHEVGGIAAFARRRGLHAGSPEAAAASFLLARYVHAELAKDASLLTAGFVMHLELHLLRKAGKQGLLTPEVVSAGQITIDESHALYRTSIYLLNMMRSSDSFQGIDAVALLLRRDRIRLTNSEGLTLWDHLENKLTEFAPKMDYPSELVPIVTGWPEDPDAKAAARAFVECMTQVFSKPEDQRLAELERLADRQADRPGPAAEFILWINMQAMHMRDIRLAHWAELQKARKSLQAGQS
jgi:hypothetical protein